MTMAGELCGPGCGFCGRCDGQWDTPIDDEPIVEAAGDDRDEVVDAFPVCLYCGHDACAGDCPAYYDAMDSWADEARFESYRDREVA
jgi:hypothetical protein